MQVVINGRKWHTIIVKYVVKRLCNAKGDNMKRNNKWLDLVLYILSAEVIGMSSGLLAGSFNEFFQKYNKPPLMPPSWVFPVVWTMLFVLMGAAIFLSALFPMASTGGIIGGIVILGVAVMYLYSYLLYKKRHPGGEK